MSGDRNRVVTPYTDPDRFTPEEKAAFGEQDPRVLELARRVALEMVGDHGAVERNIRVAQIPADGTMR